MLERLRKSMRYLAVLGDESRQKLYAFVRQQPTPVTREAVADHFGISRNLAAFHLDKLVERGLLVAAYARSPGTGGPGAGRPPKVYSASDVEVDITIPERRYDVIGQILVTALDAEREGLPAREAARLAAAERGRSYARDAHRRPRANLRQDMRRACDLLAGCGYEPYILGDDILLKNCPFHQLAQQSRELVCGLNQTFLQGVTEEIAHPPSLSALLDPRDNHCCVRLAPRRRTSSGPR